MWFTCNIYEGQGHDSKPHVPRAVQKPYVTQKTSAEYLLNKINMYPMLIPLYKYHNDDFSLLLKANHLLYK